MTVIDVAAMALVGMRTSILTIFIYIFNLQGLSFLSWNIFGKIGAGIENLDPLWFSTMIIICYLCVPLLQKFKKKLLDKDNNLGYCAAVFVGGLFIIILLSAAGICDLSYVFLFAAGYCFRALGFDEDHTRGKYVFIIGIGTMLLQFVRVIMRIRYSDFGYYPQFVTISHAALGICIFYVVFYIGKRFPDNINTIAGNRVIRYLDVSSYYIFLVHGLFCRGSIFNVYMIFENLLVSTVLFIVLTLIAAEILKRISEKISAVLP